MLNYRPELPVTDNNLSYIATALHAYIIFGFVRSKPATGFKPALGTFRSDENDRHFEECISKFIYLNDNFRILWKQTFKFVARC